MKVGARDVDRSEIGRNWALRQCVRSRRLEQQAIELLQKLGCENLDDGAFRSQASLVIGELDRVVEQRRKRRDIDGDGREPILECGVGDDPGGARHGLDLLERRQRELRV